MKVTVTFGDTAVVVPCKAGWTVRELIEQATRRYRRIIEQQHREIPVNIHHLEYTDGGILDIDDLLSDLVEDREKLVAVFAEDQRGGTESPAESTSNSFSSDGGSPEAMQYYPHLEYDDPSRGEIEVNEAVLKTNTPLLVRSSSDSVLAPPHESTHPPPPPPDEESNEPPPEPEVNNVLKGALDRLHMESPPPKMKGQGQVNFSRLTKTVEFPGDRAPLGIHVVPYCSSLSGRPLGLHIKGIEVKSRSRRDNLFKEDECIVQINDTPLRDKTFEQSQEVFRQAMSSPTVRVEVLPVGSKPRYEKSLIGQLFNGDGKDSPVKVRSPTVSRALISTQPEPKLNPKVEPKQPDARAKTPEPVLQNTPPLQPKSGTLERASPTSPARPANPSPTPRTRSQSPLASRSPAAPAPSLSNLTNKKAGKRIKIDLRKGTEGLGFTVVTRDSTVHGPGPILVKNILQRGAAVKDGRLRPGDRILEVNGVDMTGRTQEELVAMLRSTKQGEVVSVLVARQEDIFLPRELKGEEVSSQMSEDGREQLMYEIPLNETGSAGLGVSLKGNRSKETGEDLGIFIKSIIHGGAAYKDGRLRINDQMIAVNGESLLGRSNHAAMETLRRSMSSEGNMRGTIQLVVLRASRQAGSGNSMPRTATNSNSNHQPGVKADSSNQEPRSLDSNQRPTRPAQPESTMNGYGDSRTPAAAAAANGIDGYYSNDEEEQGFPPPPSPGSVEELSRDLPLAPPQHSEAPGMSGAFYPNSRLIKEKDNVPRNRTSKSMDLVADESNVGSLAGQRNESRFGGALGPTLGLMKSSSLESLQTAVSEAQQSRSQAQVPFHRPRPQVVRGRACNQSFRCAIDKSYDGPSEDDDDLSDNSSGHETPASTSSRQELDVDDGKKKKKTKGKKTEKKPKGKKTTEELEDRPRKKPKKSKEKKSVDLEDEPDKKSKKKGFALLRFGKKKEDKRSKDPAKGSTNRLEALSEEELDRNPDSRDGYATPDGVSLPDMEDDDSDPNYARINFRQPPSPLSLSRTPSPAIPRGGPGQPQAPLEDLDGLYAKVNKSRPPPAQSQPQAQPDGDYRIQGLRREYQQARAAPGYEELEAARRRVLEHDPNRMAPRGAESRPRQRYEELDLDYNQPPRRDPYDYPTHSRPVPREPAPYPGPYQDPPVSSNSGRLPLPQSSGQSQQAPPYQRHHPSGQQHRAALRQDVPPSPTAGRRGRPYYDPNAGRGDGYRQASPGRYGSPDGYPTARERNASTDSYRYGDEGQPEPRRKDPMIGAV
ncbi:par-3 family cell polarity regulator beta a isoform 2-T3 [Fundulus diaphanus]